MLGEEAEAGHPAGEDAADEADLLQGEPLGAPRRLRGLRAVVVGDAPHQRLHAQDQRLDQLLAVVHLRQARHGRMSTAVRPREYSRTEAGVQSY
eukprot:7847051-Pyramimonas_sp.AAC.1